MTHWTVVREHVSRCGRYRIVVHVNPDNMYRFELSVMDHLGRNARERWLRWGGTGFFTTLEECEAEAMRLTGFSAEARSAQV